MNVESKQPTNGEPAADPEAPTKRKATWKRRLLAIMFGGVVSIAMLFVGELAVRLFCPFVQLQGTARELYRYDEGGPDWKPGATGISFGANCQIDELGCREVGSPQAPERSWLVLGDSVAFGVGVDGTKTFCGVHQSRHPDVRVLNSGVCGAGSHDQLRVARRLIDKVEPKIDRITVCFVLNDIGEGIKFDQEKLSTTDRMLHPENRNGLVMELVKLVRTRSKLYVMAKGILTDPPARYFNWELQKYRKWNPDEPGDIGELLEIAKLAKEEEIAFDVFLFPYTGQYSSDAEDVWLPQEKMQRFLENNSVRVIDTREWFAGPEMKRYFLFADGCHFSELGHELVYNKIREHQEQVTTDTGP